MARVLFVHDVKHEKSAGGAMSSGVACAAAAATTSQVIEFANCGYAEEAITAAKADAEKQGAHLLCFRLYRPERSF